VGGRRPGLTSWLTVVFLVLGALALTWAARRWYLWQRVRADRGTAYVIEEEAIAWRHEEKQWVLAELAGGFARVLRVPGPEALGERWRWQADAHARRSGTGARISSLRRSGRCITTMTR
jgi:hypothetical protein